jgi:hypothetical protein
MNNSGLTVAKVRGLHGNQWLILRSSFTQNGELADGVDLVHQSNPGRFVDFGAGSDWGTAVENLRAKGVPDDVIAELPGVTLTPTSASAAKHPFADFVGTWGGHERLLTIGTDHTGKLILGVGCCDSVSVAMKYTLQPDGRLAGTAAGKPSYTGTAMNSVTFGPGPSVWFYFQSTPEGEFLMSDGPGNASGTTWCSDQQAGLCGA